MAVLERVGLVRRAGTKTGRGGTGVLYESASATLSFGGLEATSGMTKLVTAGLVNDPEAFAFLRRVHLTPAQVKHLTDHLDSLVWQVPDTKGAPAAAVFVSVFRT